MRWIDPPIVIDAHGRHAQAVRFTQDSRLLLSAGMDKMVHLWTVPQFESIGAFEGHANSVNSISLSPDEHLLATASSDGTVRIWTMPTGETIRVLHRQGHARFSHNGQFLATIGKNGRARLWDTQTWENIVTLPALDKRSFSLAFSPDDSALLIGGTDAIHIFCIQDGDLVGRLEGHGLAVPSLLFRPQGDLLASTGADGTLRFWSCDSWSLVGQVPIGAKGVYSIAFAGQGQSILLSADHRILELGVPTGNRIQEVSLPVKGVYGVHVSEDDQFLANAAADGKIRVWRSRQ